MTVSAPARQSPVSAPLFALPRLATSFAGTAIVTLTLPQIVVASVGDARKGLHLGAITAAASLASLAALYLSGRHSDRRRLTSGRRHLPAVWLAVMIGPLLALAVGASYPVVVGAVLALVVTRSLCDAAHLPIVADDFAGPDASGNDGLAGRLSGHIAFQQFLGSGLGALAFAWLPAVVPSPTLRVSAAPAAIVFAVVAAVGILRSYRGPAPSRRAAGGAAEPGWFPPSLRNLLAARTLFMAGVFVISTFLVFFVRDVLGARDVERVTATLFGGTVLGALFSSLPAGRLAGRVGDRPMLFAAGFAVALVAPAFVILAPGRPAVALSCMLLYGAAFGIVVTSGLSLTLSVVGDPARAGRIMALASATTFVSQAAASGAGAMVLDPLNRLRPNAGYYALVALIELLLVSGGMFLRRVEAGSRETSG